MKILVIGSKGTLGTPLTVELRKRGHDVVEVDLQHHVGYQYARADIADYRQMERIFDAHKFDYVYLLAAEFGRHNGEHHYEQCWRTNVIGTRNILELQRKYGFRLVFTSSSEIYGECGSIVLSESLSDEIPLHQHNDYAISKWVNEQQCMNFGKEGSEIVRLRLFNAYGPGEHYHQYRSVVCLFGYRALHGIPYNVYKDYYRVFQYVDDLIPTMANVVSNFTPGEVYNVGGREYTSVEEMHEGICSLLTPDERARLDVAFLDRDEHNVVSKRPDITKAAKDLGHDPKVKLEEGLPRTIEWMRKVYGVPARIRAAG